MSIQFPRVSASREGSPQSLMSATAHRLLTQTSCDRVAFFWDRIQASGLVDSRRGFLVAVFDGSARECFLPTVICPQAARLHMSPSRAQASDRADAAATAHHSILSRLRVSSPIHHSAVSHPSRIRQQSRGVRPSALPHRLSVDVFDIGGGLLPNELRGTAFFFPLSPLKM